MIHNLIQCNTYLYRERKTFFIIINYLLLIELIYCMENLQRFIKRFAEKENVKTVTTSNQITID